MTAPTPPVDVEIGDVIARTCRAVLECSQTAR